MAVEFMGLPRREGKSGIATLSGARCYRVGDKVTVLVPEWRNRLQAAREGPFKPIKSFAEENSGVELSTFPRWGD